MSEKISLNSLKDDDRSSSSSSSGSLLGKFINIILGVAILASTGYISYKWLTNRPKTQRKPHEQKAALVEVTEISASKHDVIVDAMGTVIPARNLDLTSRVSGEVIRVSPKFFPGGYLNKGELVIEIDKEDYKLLLEESEFALEKASLAITQSKLAVEKSNLAIEQSELAIEQRKADIVKAEKDLKVEEGQQKIAQREYEVLGETISEKDKELVLRQPQYKSAKASVEAAKARLKEAEAQKKTAEAEKRSVEAAKISAEAEKSRAEIAIKKAKLNLRRTDILAPFNAVIQEKKVEIGSQVSIGTPIVTIINSDEYWIQVSVPVDRLKWISIPDLTHTKGSSVRIYYEAGWGKGVSRIGTVKRLMTEVESEGRMAKLLVSVKDPLNLKNGYKNKPQMILGSYVRVEIEGKELPEVFCIPRLSLRDENHVWIMKPDNTLDIRSVDIIWSEKKTVCIADNLMDGELLITSDLSTPVKGMALRLLNTNSQSTSSSREKTASEYTGKERKE